MLFMNFKCVHTYCGKLNLFVWMEFLMTSFHFYQVTMPSMVDQPSSNAANITPNNAFGTLIPFDFRYFFAFCICSQDEKYFIIVSSRKENEFKCFVQTNQSDAIRICEWTEWEPLHIHIHRERETKTYSIERTIDNATEIRWATQNSATKRLQGASLFASNGSAHCFPFPTPMEVEN